MAKYLWLFPLVLLSLRAHASLPKIDNLTFKHEGDVKASKLINDSKHKTAKFTLSTVFSINDITKPQTIISNFEGGGFRLSLTPYSLKMNIYTSKGTVEGLIKINLLESKKFYHLTATYDGKHLAMYLNGELIRKEEGSGNVYYKFNNPLCLADEATSKSCKDGNFSGVIKNAYMWNTDLSYGDIQVLADSYTALTKEKNFTNKLIAKWDFSKADDYYPAANLKLVNGTNGKAQTFSGNEYIQVKSSKPLNPKVVTLSALVKFDKLDSFQYIASKIQEKGGFGLYLTGYNLRFKIHTPAGTINSDYSVKKLVSNKWYHVVGTYDGKESKLYVDGVLVDANKFSGNLVYTYANDNFCIGSDIGKKTCSKKSNLFTGQISDVSIWEKALSPVEIQNLNGSFTANIAHLKCDNSTTSTPFKVMSYNIFKARGMEVSANSPISLALEEANLKLLAKAIKAKNPDVVILNEANHVSKVANAQGNDLIQQHAMYLSKTLGYKYVINFTKSEFLFRDTTKKRSSATGSAILSKFPFVENSQKRYLLPKTKDSTDAVRIVGKIQVNVGKGKLPLNILATHMGVTLGEDRVLQAKYIVANILPELNGPFVFAGDINADPYRSKLDNEVFDIFKSAMTVKMFKKDMLRTTRSGGSDIDHILYNGHGQMTLLGAAYESVDELVASDHRPVTLDMCLKKMN